MAVTIAVPVWTALLGITNVCHGENSLIIVCMLALKYYRREQLHMLNTDQLA